MWFQQTKMGSEDIMHSTFLSDVTINWLGNPLKLFLHKSSIYTYELWTCRNHILCHRKHSKMCDVILSDCTWNVDKPIWKIKLNFKMDYNVTDRWTLVWKIRLPSLEIICYWTNHTNRKYIYLMINIYSSLYLLRHFYLYTQLARF